MQTGSPEAVVQALNRLFGSSSGGVSWQTSVASASRAGRSSPAHETPPIPADAVAVVISEDALADDRGPVVEALRNIGQGALDTIKEAIATARENPVTTTLFYGGLAVAAYFFPIVGAVTGAITLGTSAFHLVRGAVRAAGAESEQAREEGFGEVGRGLVGVVLFGISKAVGGIRGIVRRIPGLNLLDDSASAASAASSR